jgi:hypothetical protein
MKTARYVELLEDADVLTVAEELGLKIFDRGNGSFQCPTCGTVTRYNERNRGACGLTNDGKGWHCWSCEQSGDAINVVCFVMFGKKGLPDLTDDERKRVSEWVYRRDGAAAPLRKLHIVRPTKPLRSPDLIASIWGECSRVDEDPQVAAWLESKRIDVNRVADLDLARALPLKSQVTPSWASGGQRLIVPMRDASGAVRNVKARRVDGGKEYKSLSPSGYAAAGLAFFDPTVANPNRVWIVEGEKKFLQLATRIAAQSAVFGVGSGMYSPELIARIPPDAEVIVATDADPKHQAGAKYATDIIRMLTPVQRKRARLWNSLEVVGDPGKRRVQVREMWLDPEKPR